MIALYFSLDFDSAAEAILLATPYTCYTALHTCYTPPDTEVGNKNALAHASSPVLSGDTALEQDVGKGFWLSLSVDLMICQAWLRGSHGQL